MVHPLGPFWSGQNGRKGARLQPVHGNTCCNQHGQAQGGLPDEFARLRNGQRTGLVNELEGSAWHKQRIAAPLRSGLYYFHVKNERGEIVKKMVTVYGAPIAADEENPVVEYLAAIRGR